MKKVKVDTILRTVLMVLVLANQILTNCGHCLLPFDNAQVQNIVTTALTVVMTLRVFWKNNSFTQEAIAADEYIELKKKEKYNDN